MYILTSKFVKNFYISKRKAKLHVRKYDYDFIETTTDVYLLRDKLCEEFIQINLDTSQVIHLGYSYLIRYLLEEGYIIILKKETEE